MLFFGWAAGAVLVMVLLSVLLGGGHIALGTGLDGGVVLDDVGDEEVAGDQEVQKQAEVDVGFAEVMAANAYQDAVLLRVVSYPDS